MSISQDSGAIIVCREVFDEDSRPSTEEIVEYAKRLGIDPDAEPHLLDLACAGLMAPLPKGWSPCLDEATGAWYYYQASTRTTTWEHPLDARHRALVERERARAANTPRQLSLDDDSKTMAKELESHEEASSPKDISLSKVPVLMTKIPTKLAPLSRKTMTQEPPIVRRRECSTERLHRRNSATDTSRSENPNSSLMTDREARDYTNVIFRDPKFFETPKLLDSPERQRRLKEIVNRSESKSPRYEKDWEQLSKNFSSTENVIDIDKLSASSLTPYDIGEPQSDVEIVKHSRKANEQKELTLSGGGAMFLKSKKSRDRAACEEKGSAEQSRPAAPGTNEENNSTESGNDNAGHSLDGKPKSILREKPIDDEERPMEEERKSVRFDLEKDPQNIKFTFSNFENDVEDAADNLEDSDSEGSVRSGSKHRETYRSDLRKIDMKNRDISSELTWLSDHRRASQDSDEEEPDFGVGVDVKNSARKNSDLINKLNEDSDNGTSPRTRSRSKSDDRESKGEEINEKDAESVDDLGIENEQVSKRAQVVGRRFLVENVSEKEHLNQLSSIESNDTSKNYLPKYKFGSVKNIDIFSKSESDSTAGKNSSQGEAASSLLDEIRKNKELMLESMKRTDQRVKRDKQKEKDEVYHMVKLRHDLEAVSQERGRSSQQNFDDVKFAMSKQHDRALGIFKRELDASLDITKREMEANFEEEKFKLQQDFEKRLNDLRADMAKKEEEEINKLVMEMDELRMENLKKVRNELEICYEKERQDILENLKTELDQRKRELIDLRNQEMEKLQSEHDKDLADEKIRLLSEHEVRKQHNDKIEAMKRELEKEFDDLRNVLRTEQREKVTKITEDHEKCLADILRDFRVDEGVARKVYKQRLEEIRSDYSRDTETEVKKQAERVSRQETVDFEKIRCEKRLLEDKYKTLKDKYSKLKNDVRLAVERRSKRKEGNTTTSETEKSTSARTRTERTESSDQKASPTNTRSNPTTNMGFERTQPAASGTSNQNQANISAAEDSEGGQRSATGFQRSGLGHGDCSSRSSAKFESDDATTASETVNSNVLKNKRKSFARRSTSSVKQQSHNNNNVNGSDNPVENIRKQLEKLEDLGDHLPSNESAYTLRYPFQDKAPANASSELEFFRHRIHVERDSVKRAREALKVQRSAFQSRQRAWKQRSARASLEQLVQEERELSDMEVSLHRTRSLLGEKVIYLRHLEQSLERVANAKRNESESVPLKNDEMTLSDMSSASSGFSSTDLGTDTFIDKPDHYHESTEIIASLENLNSEIREIWGVLNKRQDNNIPPPPTLMYSDLGWLPFQHLTTQSSNVQGFGTPNIQSNILSQLTTAHPPTTTTQNIIAQYGPNSGFTTSVGTVDRGASSLIERTRHMRDWLRQARLESTDLISPGQATL